MTYQIGIDLGTTFTAAAVHRDGRSSIFSLGNQNASIPSVVLLREDQTELVGEAAVRRALNEPERVAREFKRRLGDSTPLIVGGAPYSAEQLMARLLKTVVASIAEREGSAPDRIALTHPANWGPYKIDLLQQAVRISGLPSDRVDLITEPEAAAISYATQERVEPGQIVAVYDLGGGTFDAAVLRRTADGFELIGRPEGIERLGGIDFDAAVFAHVDRALDGKLAELDPDDPLVVSGVARLREECVAAKIALSSDTDATIPVLLPSLQTEVRITRSEFENLIRPALSDSIAAMHRALDSASVAPEQVDKVLLVGGSSRIPLISQMVSSELGRPVAVDADPKHAIALGAAAFAAGALSDAPDAGPAAGAATAAAATTAALPAEPTLPPTMPIPSTPPAPTQMPATPPPATTEMPATPTPATTQMPAMAAPTTQMSATPGEPNGGAAAGGAPPPGATPRTSASGGSKTPMYLVAGLVGVVAIAVVAFLVLGGGGDSDDAADSTVVAESAAPLVDTTVAATETTVDGAVTTTPETTPTTEAAPPDTIDDGTLQANAQQAVAAVSPNILATVTGGVATLTGPADETTAQSAVDAARGVEGVSDVVSQLTILAADEVCSDEIMALGRWACITDVTFDGTTVRATYAFDDAGTAWSTNGAYHLHFYSDEWSAEQAGMPIAGGSSGGGVWQVWDQPDVFEDTAALFSGEPQRLCVVVANAGHAIEELGSGNCWPVTRI